VIVTNILHRFAKKVSRFLVCIRSCTNPLEDPDLPEKLTVGGQPDLGIVDGSWYQRCYWILCHRLRIPYISLTTFDEPWLRRLPVLPSFAPFVYTGKWFTEQMTFWERVQNTAAVVDWILWPRFELVEEAIVQRYLPGESYATLAARSLLWFIDTDVILDYPRPTMANEESYSFRSFQWLVVMIAKVLLRECGRPRLDGLENGVRWMVDSGARSLQC
jgi:hypothetical protein